MLYVLSTFLIALIIAWVLTLHYQHKVGELQQQLTEKESERLAIVSAMSKEYEDHIKRIREENDMLRRRLG